MLTMISTYGRFVRLGFPGSVKMLARKRFRTSVDVPCSSTSVSPGCSRPTDEKLKYTLSAVSIAVRGSGTGVQDPVRLNGADSSSSQSEDGSDRDIV